MKKHISKILAIIVVINIISLNYSFASDSIDRYSKGSILIDQMTDRVLYQKNPDEKMPLASLSKMMTFLIAIESIKDNKVKSDDLVTIDKEIAKVRGSTYKLRVGEKVPLIELMKGLMIVSGNDAAVAISKHIAGSVDEFVKIMNKKTKELGMKNTSFVNPNGLPIYSLSDPKKPPKENISTARDISILAKYMFDNYEKEVTSITDMDTYSYPERGFCKNNTNALLQMIPEVDGVKTGYTGNAGYCLCFSMKVSDKSIDNRLIGVVLGANHKQKRIQSALSMLKYGKNNFETKKIITKDDLIGKKYIKGINELEVSLEAQDDLYIVCKKNEKLKSETTIREIDYPIKKGDVCGIIKYYDETGEKIGDVKIISRNSLEKMDLKTKIKMMCSKY